MVAERFIGKPCRICGKCERYLRSRCCVSCARELSRKNWKENRETQQCYAKKWRAKNKKKVEENQEKWRIKNRERVREHNRKSHRRNLEKRRKKLREWHKINPLKSQISRKNWLNKNPEKQKKLEKTSRARKRGFQMLYKLQVVMQEIKDANMQPNLKRMTVEQLFEAFEKAMQLSAEGLRQAAAIYAELAERGADLRRLGRSEFIATLPDIACGKMLPELALQVANTPSLRRYVVGLVKEDQAKLARSDAAVTVLFPTGEEKAIPVGNLTVVQMRQVFGDGRIRTPAEQRKHMVSAGYPAKTDKALEEAAFNVRQWLTEAERAHLAEQAADREMTPGELIVATLRGRVAIDPLPQSAKKARTASKAEVRV